ncbi:hypothetical protein PtA15_4A255 [Puccinia triticina]|uniref:RRM domain-containing protein n=1 Tax=Puccinia triticina TaxID=208348 RepID=A0ABY7CF20_9BASI|nr:uncharacterized protein PtA15_4A255 [Puccinia triticina]WAQ83806.1 hypothetical protein PtA15_4A255 [Puccinia triticina]
MANANSSNTGGYNYYQPTDIQAFNQSTSYTSLASSATAGHHSYYDPAAIAIANATGITPSVSTGHHHQHQQSGSNGAFNHHSKLDAAFDANVAAQQSIYTPDATKLNKGKARTTVIRKAGGEVWEDQTLMEWDPGTDFVSVFSISKIIRRLTSKPTIKKKTAHFRLFVGDLAPEVSDDGLAAAFSKWSSFVKARVVRDKVTTKSKGYGFVSYKDPEDFMKAWKEMNGKYVGSRPIKISKATTKVGMVQIGNKKARTLDDHRKKKLIQGVERLRTGAGAVWKNDNRPYARR